MSRRIDEDAPQIRDLIKILERAGLIDRGGRGSHQNDEHPSGSRVTISGNPGVDAKPYQEREVRQAIEDLQSGEEPEESQ